MKTNTTSNGGTATQRLSQYTEPPSPRSELQREDGVSEQAHGHCNRRDGDTPSVGDVRAAVRRALSDEHWREVDAHLASLDQAIGLLPDVGTQQSLLHMTAACRKDLETLRSDLRGFVDADRPGTSPAALYVRNVKLVLDCRAVVGALRDVQRQAEPHAGKTSVAKAIALAVGGLVLLAAMATVAIIFAPVVVPGLTLSGFIVLGSGAGACAVTALTMLGLAIREMVAKPDAYRHLPDSQPQLVREIMSLDDALMAWFHGNQSRFDDDATGAGLPDDAFGPGGRQAFLHEVRSSRLPEEIKAAVERIHGGSTVRDPESSAQRSTLTPTDVALAAASGMAPASPAEKATSVTLRKVGAAKQLESVVTIRVWPEDLKAHRLGHAAASTRTPGNELYHSFWPEERSTNPMRSHRGVALDQCYRKDKTHALHPATRRALERGEFQPRGLQKPVQTIDQRTWGLPASKVYLPVFGKNEVRETGEPKPCLFGLDAVEMRELWRDEARGYNGVEPKFKAFSKTRNCAGMILRLMAAGGSALFVAPPKFRFFALPSAVLEYATEVERRISALNSKADVLIEYGHNAIGIDVGITLEQAWADYKAALAQRAADAGVDPGSPAGLDLATMFTDEQVLDKNPATLMKMAALLLDEDDRHQREMNPDLMLANGKQRVPLTLLCALRSAMCEPAALRRAESMASQGSYQSLYLDDDADEPMEQTSQDDVADSENPEPAAMQAEAGGDQSQVTQASQGPGDAPNDAAVRDALPPPALNMDDPAAVVEAWRKTVEWASKKLDAAQIHLKLLSPMSPDTIPLPESDAVAENNLAARYAMLDRLLPPLLTLTTLADVSPNAFPRFEALVGLAWEMTQAGDLKPRPGKALPMAGQGLLSVPLQALPPERQDAAAAQWRAVTEKARTLSVALETLCDQLRDPSLKSGAMLARLAHGNVVAQIRKLERQMAAVLPVESAPSTVPSPPGLPSS